MPPVPGGAPLPRPRIVVLGDSLTSGHGIERRRAFPALLQERIDENGLRYVVVNEGISGDTSAGGVRRVTRALALGAELLLLALGINDGLRGVPAAQVKANLSTIITTAHERHIPVLLCRMEALPLYGWSYTTAFHRLYDELATLHSVPLVPFFLQEVIGRPSLMQSDQLHPNADGAKVIAELIWPHLLQALTTR